MSVLEATTELRTRPFPQIRGGGEDNGGKPTSPLTVPTWIRREYMKPVVGQDFLDRHPRIVQVASRLMSSEFGWDLPIARWVVGRGLSVQPEDSVGDGKGIPSAILLLWGDKVVGISTQRSIEIETREGNKTMTQHLVRAIMPDFRKQGWGGRFLEELLKIHQDEFYGHCSQAVATFYTNMRSGQFEPGTYAPFEVKHNLTGVRRDLLVGYWNRRKVHGRKINKSTGVSKNDFPQRNKNFRPIEGHAGTETLFELITSKEFGMEFPEDPNAPKNIGTDSLSAIAQRK